MSVTAAIGESEYKVPEFWTEKVSGKVSYLLPTKSRWCVSPLEREFLWNSRKGKRRDFAWPACAHVLSTSSNTEGAGLVGRTDFLVGNV